MKGVQWVVKDEKKENVFWPSEEMKKRAYFDKSIYEEASKDRVAFWEKRAREGIDWFKEWDKAYEEDLPNFKWFIGAKVNACYNALDRHVKAGKGDKVALIWEPEPTDEEVKKFTYSELFEEVCKFANVLKSLGVKKGDRVGIYLPMVPEVVVSLLACARIGAIHSVVFSAFSGQSLNERMDDAAAKVLITADGYYRRGKPLNLKSQADIGAEGTKVEHVIVVKRTGGEIEMLEGRDQWFHELMEKVDAECEPEEMNRRPAFYSLHFGNHWKAKGSNSRNRRLHHACLLDHKA